MYLYSNFKSDMIRRFLKKCRIPLDSESTTSLATGFKTITVPLKCKSDSSIEGQLMQVSFQETNQIPDWHCGLRSAMNNFWSSAESLYSGPAAWNSLPSDLHDVADSATLKRQNNFWSCLSATSVWQSRTFCRATPYKLHIILNLSKHISTFVTTFGSFQTSGYSRSG